MEEQLPALIAQLDSRDEAQRIRAAHALGDSGDQGAVPHLIRLLETTCVPAVRNAAAVGLRGLGDRSAVPALVQQLRHPQNATNRGTLFYALQSLDAREALPDLTEGICSGTYEVMVMALEVIAAFQGPVEPAAMTAALIRLRHCRSEAHDDWQQELLDAAMTVLEQGGSRELERP